MAAPSKHSTISIPVNMLARIDSACERYLVSRAVLLGFLLKAAQGMLERAVPAGQVALAIEQRAKVQQPFTGKTEHISVDRGCVEALRPFALALQLGLSAMINDCFDVLLSDEGKIIDPPGVDGLGGNVDRALVQLTRTPMRPLTQED